MIAEKTHPGLDKKVKDSVDCLLGHIRKNEGMGYDPYDCRVGKMYEFFGQTRKTLKGKVTRLFLYGIEFFAPVTFRKIRGIPRTYDPMGNSYWAGAQMAMYLADNDQSRLDEARKVLDKVVTKSVGDPGKRGFALGFPCVTGSGILWRTDVPVSHYTLRVVRKLMIWERVVGDGRYQAVIDEAMKFLTEVLEYVEVDGMLGVAYTPADPLQVVNIWADVASILACYSVGRKDDIYKDMAIGLARSVVKHHLPDGTWPYFAKWSKKPFSIDNSHTAMVLGALADVAICYPDEVGAEIRPVLESGTAKWLELFYNEETGQHWMEPHKHHVCFSVSVGDALYAIHRLVRPELGLSEGLMKRLETARERLINWSIKVLPNFDGRWCVRKYPMKRYSVGGVRSFDGLTADGLAITYAESRLPRDSVSKLWTI